MFFLESGHFRGINGIFREYDSLDNQGEKSWCETIFECIIVYAPINLCIHEYHEYLISQNI